MNKFILFSLLLLTLLTTQAEARWFYRGCRHYMDPTLADYDGIYYGYVDNLNYPDPYALPLNYYFNNRTMGRRDAANYRYMLRCLRYSCPQN